MQRTCFGPPLVAAAPALVPTGKLLAQLGFGATSRARFESNGIIIGGSQGSAGSSRSRRLPGAESPRER